MYATLGNIEFINLKGFSDFSKTGSATYAEHKPLVGKPRLESTGPNLDEIALTMRFHASFCKPALELAALKAYRDESEILALLTAGGKNEGMYVITDLNETIEEADREGRVISYIVSCSLKEYVIENKLQLQQDEDRKKAVAVGPKKPVASTKKNVPTCPQQISKIVASIDSSSKAITAVIQTKGSVRPIENRKVVTENINKILAHCDDIFARYVDESSCMYQRFSIRDKALYIVSNARTLKTQSDAQQIFRVPSTNAELVKWVQELKKSTDYFVQNTVTRKW